MESIFPEVKAVDPRAYLADRVKRGVAFVAVLSSLGKETDLKTSGHISDDTPRPIDG